MADNETEQKSLENTAENFFAKTKYLWIALICAVLVALAIVLITTKVNTSTKNKAFNDLDKIVFDYENAIKDTDDMGIADAEKNFIASLEEFAKKYGNNSKSIRAYMMIAKQYMEKSNYESALFYWEKAASCDKNSYLAGISLFNAGVCYEQLGKLEEAKMSYAKCASNKNFMPKSHALFNEARVFELMNNTDEAINLYSSIVDIYSDDEWAKLAKSRIIALTVNE